MPKRQARKAAKRGSNADAGPSEDRSGSKAFGAQANEDPVLRAILGFLRALSGPWAAIERDLTESEWHALGHERQS
jgi:hypothetical protein